MSKIIEVHVWYMSSSGGQFRAGHSSLTLSDGFYISWWPLGRGKEVLNGPVPPDFQRTLEQDCDEEGDSPVTININVTEDQEQKIRSYFEKLCKSEARYNIGNKNCSTVVFEALSEAFPELGKVDSVIMNPGYVKFFADYLSRDRDSTTMMDPFSALVEYTRRVDFNDFLPHDWLREKSMKFVNTWDNFLKKVETKILRL